VKRPAVRTSHIVLRVTPAEKAAVFAKAATAGVTVTRLVADSVAKSVVVSPDPEAVELRLQVVDALAQIRELKIGAPDCEDRLIAVETLLEGIMGRLLK
jgi:ethanolamine utilization microcompartment shell protein EutS